MKIRVFEINGETEVFYGNCKYPLDICTENGEAFEIHFKGSETETATFHKAEWDYEIVNEPEQPEQEPAETRQERTDRENREHCRRIAETLEAYARGDMYKCPECGEEIEIDDLDDLTTETDDGETLYKLPCGCTVDEEPEQLSLYDYFNDVLDIEYRIESDRKTVRSVSLMLACGGPNIYIDTAEKAVMLYWWTDRARYSFDRWISDEIEAWAQELWDIG